MSEEIKPKRRDFLFTATYTIGAVGLATAIWPLIDQMNPDSSVKALSTTEVDISNIEPGKTITVQETDNGQILPDTFPGLKDIVPPGHMAAI